MTKILIDKDYIDTIVIGAGLSGICAAYHLQNDCPQKSYAIFEGRDSIGGTWDLFKYPGIRSDSDMFTYGYNFKPWTDPDSLASADKIMSYLRETIEENNIKNKIRLNHKVKKLSWSSEDSLWSITVEVNGETKYFESQFIFCCSGYYNYEQGYQPEFKNKDQFKGTFIHPQHWPENLDYTNKNIVVIGSGATAVTLVPNLVDKAKHVTLLQRSPTYIMPMAMQDPLLMFFRKFLPDIWVSRFARKRNVWMSSLIHKTMTKYPNWARNFIKKKQDEILLKDIDRKHFTPTYAPWDQRLCLVPDGDLFKVLNEGKASIKTDTIEEFTHTGIKLSSGEHLDADIIVSATGLNIEILSGVELEVDGKMVPYGDKMFYRGVLLEDVPNFGLVFGYTNASWTLKAELVSRYFCRIINYMDEKKKISCTPRDTGDVDRELFLNLTSGYIKRAQTQIPKQGHKQPWRLDQNYKIDKARLQSVDIDDGVLKFRE